MNNDDSKTASTFYASCKLGFTVISGILRKTKVGCHKIFEGEVARPEGPRSGEVLREGQQPCSLPAMVIVRHFKSSSWPHRKWEVVHTALRNDDTLDSWGTIPNLWVSRGVRRRRNIPDCNFDELQISYYGHSKAPLFLTCGRLEFRICMCVGSHHSNETQRHVSSAVAELWK